MKIRAASIALHSITTKGIYFILFTLDVNHSALMIVLNNVRIENKLMIHKFDLIIHFQSMD